MIYDFGFNMGPFAMADLVGLDLGWRARKLAGVKEKQLNQIVPTSYASSDAWDRRPMPVSTPTPKAAAGDIRTPRSHKSSRKPPRNSASNAKSSMTIKS